MQALGNDFVVIETITQTFKATPERIKKLADRHYGIGCDQVLIIGMTDNPQADFDYTIYNNDGSSAKQCGNGARCVGLFIKEEGLSSKNKITLATDDHLTHVDLSHPKNISVEIGVPVFDHEKSEQLTMGVLSIGNPHLIIQVPDVTQADVDNIGKSYNQQNPLFPEGVNVSFCQIIAKQHVKLRVFERGVGETLACGSAASATMAYLRHLNLIDDNVKIDLPGGELTVSWTGGENPVILTGDAENVFTGVYTL
jgi:diaminopimelate epimerase